jgi:hypothetical protein
MRTSKKGGVMDNKSGSKKNFVEIEKSRYVAPKMQKHEPVKVVQGSGGCSGYYYTSLYYY